jgi:hypothetical protein
VFSYYQFYAKNLEVCRNVAIFAVHLWVHTAINIAKTQLTDMRHGTKPDYKHRINNNKVA